MHWHCIRRSQRTRADIGSTSQISHEPSRNDGLSTVLAAGPGIGNDDAADERSDHSPPTSTPSAYISSYASSFTTFGYQLACRNHINSSKLRRDGELDIHHFNPIFIHDVLMLPGSLASLLDKGSSEDIIPRLTPAMLPGFLPRIHSTTNEPCIIPSTDPKDRVSGLLLLGQGRRQRECIHAHYGPQCKRVKAEVVIDVIREGGTANTGLTGGRRRQCLRKKKLRAYVWICADESGNADHRQTRAKKGLDWNLEAWLGGEHERKMGLRVVNGVGDDELLCLSDEDEKA